MNHIFDGVKKVCTGLFTLFVVVSAFGQDKTPSFSHHVKTVSKDSSKSKEARGLELAQVLREIDSGMVKVDGGSFTMGCTAEQDSDCYYWEKPAHTVQLNSFYISKFDVTQKVWEAVMGTKPWWSKNCDDCPVENVSWNDAQLFIEKLNQLTGLFYRLPSEAEWEYAARGGSKSQGSKYAGSAHANAVAWFDINSEKHTHPVGQKKPNELGLYDMSGNVWQWCYDWFNDKYYSTSPPSNPDGPKKDLYRVVRGGSWWSEVDNCRVSNRDRYPSEAADDDVGFRLAKD